MHNELQVRSKYGRRVLVGEFNALGEVNTLTLSIFEEEDDNKQEINILIEESQARKIRDKLNEMYPLPVAGVANPTSDAKSIDFAMLAAAAEFGVRGSEGEQPIIQIGTVNITVNK